MTNRDYFNSRPLDVHRWSDHPEVNSFVNRIYEEQIHYPGENARIKKKHLKVVLLDLYVAWSEDPEQSIGVHMSPNAYSNGLVTPRGKSRYNALNIKPSTIEIVRRLHDLGLIGLEQGGPEELGKGYVTRIWTAEPLIEMFRDALFTYFDVGYADHKETVILRDSDKKDIEYEDNRSTKRMRDLLVRYNRLLERTFIDIPSLDKPKIVIPPKKNRRKKDNKPTIVHVTHHDKFVRRIFNNGTFKDGGRFYGGWWQRVGSEYRKDIRMNNVPTVEIDYSSLHVILAYSEVGIEYWKMTSEDPYDLPVRGVNNPDHCRAITKLLFLLGFNANNEDALFKAFRNQHDYKAYPHSFPDDVLSELLTGIRDRHPKISHLICSGAGLRLMNLDAQMCEYVIEKFVEQDIPILTVHDSFVVPFDEGDRLHRLMKEAFEHVTRKKKIQAKWNANLTKAQLYAHGATDRNWFLDMIEVIRKPEMAKGYRLRMERHRAVYSESG